MHNPPPGPHLLCAPVAGLHGAKVVVTGRRQEVLDSACQAMREEGIHVLGLQGDVRKQSACQGWVQEVGGEAGLGGRVCGLWARG